MPLINLNIGPFTNIYCGDYNSNAKLTPIFSIATAGFTIVDEIPENYEPVADNSVQSGYRKITLNMALYFDPNDLISIKLARGLNLSNIDQNAGSDFGQYTLLLGSADDTKVNSVLLPKCYTIKRYAPNFEKTAPTKIDLQFVAYNRNRFIELFEQKSLDDLATILGPKSPLG